MGRLLVVDIEATCWAGSTPPAGEHSEVIEIGLCELDTESLQMKPPVSLLIRPQRSYISEFCTQLTHITPQMAAAGLLFNDACVLLRRDYGTQECVWGSWGRFDRRMLQAQCRVLQVTFPFSRKYVDFRKLSAMVQNQGQRGKPRQTGLMHTLKALNIEFEGTPHRVGSDAYNTARILRVLMQQYGRQIIRA